MLVCTYAEALRVNAVLKRTVHDAATFSNLSQKSSPGNRRGTVVASFNLTENQQNELLEALIKIYDQTTDPEERAGKFQSKLYEMFPEGQNSVAIASGYSTGAYHISYLITIYIDETLVDGFGL
ncbi:hypothetical protein ILUMI_06165 [Ignelater luminosus]|uniref:Uncharacterized protein n=1 Tax=Ignelater luminosus TaxID=2038154 RepID=A0A8K0DAI8_IGNLU|nr:hypothetical protein ILUMI_06165 [Ignelater luminosus]